MTNKETICLIISSVFSVLLSSFAYADDDEQSESGISIEGSFFYHNKYIDEGMNEIPGNGIFTPEVVISFNDFSVATTRLPSFYVGAWAAIGADENYTETNFFVGKIFEWNDFSLDLRYVWLNEVEGEEEMEEENEEEEENEISEDHEIEAALSCDCLPWGIEPEIAYVYSTQMNGGAFEIELGKEIEMGSFSIEPYVEAMIDFGYVSEEYDGLNNITVGVEASIPLNDNIGVELYVAHSFAEENIRREGADDQTWGGAGLEFEF